MPRVFALCALKRCTSFGKSSWYSCLSRGVYGHCTSHSLHWKQASITRSVSGAVSLRTSPSCFLSMRSNRIGKLSQYLKHMRQPWQISKVRVTSFRRPAASQ